MSSTNKSVTIHHEVQLPADAYGYRLTFQSCTFHYDERTGKLDGYRFMYRTPKGRLQTALGQARIPSPEDLFRLLRLAAEAGWFPPDTEW